MSDDAFDRRFEIRKEHIPAALAEAMIHTTDTMEMAYACAVQVFGEGKFTAADVIAVYDRMMAVFEPKGPASQEST